ncbi:FG-GAP repeat domain-containing protein [Pelagibaculum spongiae]|uniref:VCBS repeat-containing protein n=1 Tax=Pelagibaculum spongiae TaxID=2080658 RepID=A0A2V1H371_9GAMM|nr:VCBS repeat-containing protein [Pelagibaculum spongiae]PVZ72420.1 hypothetical protein DC094_05290 [Pelagibaculum spongiae]
MNKINCSSLFVVILLIATHASASQVSISQMQDRFYFDPSESFTQTIQLTTSNFNQSVNLAVDVEFSGAVQVNNAPDSCQKSSQRKASKKTANGDQLLELQTTNFSCIISLKKHKASKKHSLVFELTTDGAGIITSKTLLKNPNIGSITRANQWIALSANTYRQKPRFENALTKLALDVDNQKGPDLVVTRTDSTGVVYLNDGQGNLTLPDDNRYIFATNQPVTALAEINNDFAKSTPELLLGFSSTGSYQISTQKQLDVDGRLSEFTPAAFLPANTPFYESFIVDANSDGAETKKWISADVDQDLAEGQNLGLEHLFIASEGRSSWLYYFSYPQNAAHSTSASFLTLGDTRDGIFHDINGDKRLDIILAKKGQNNIWLAKNSPIANRFTDRQDIGEDLLSTAITALDVNRDGYDDLIFSNQPNADASEQSTHRTQWGNLKIYLNNGQGLFNVSQQQLLTGYVDQLLALDIGGDGYQELLVAQHGGITVYRTSENGLQLIPIAAKIQTPLLIADLNRDGLPDLIGNSIILNRNWPSAMLENKQALKIQAGGGGITIWLGLFLLLIGSILFAFKKFKNSSHYN